MSSERLEIAERRLVELQPFYRDYIEAGKHAYRSLRANASPAGSKDGNNAFFSGAHLGSPNGPKVTDTLSVSDPDDAKTYFQIDSDIDFGVQPYWWRVRAFQEDQDNELAYVETVAQALRRRTMVGVSAFRYSGEVATFECADEKGRNPQCLGFIHDFPEYEGLEAHLENITGKLYNIVDKN